MLVKERLFFCENRAMKLDIEELGLLLGPEDSEVNLRYILRNASRRSGRIFEIFIRKKRVSN